MSDNTREAYRDHVLQHNCRAWDALVERKQRFTRPARDEDVANSTWLVANDRWLDGPVANRRMLCLAAGGGRQSAVYAAAGAHVTVLDISPQMLALDRQVAAERGFEVRTVAGSIDDLSMFDVGEFDVVLQPVSSCYVPEVARVYREVSRVTAPGGIYISQHKQPASLQGAVQPTHDGYALVEPYDRHGALPAVVGSPHREEGTLEFLHGWEALIGALCRSGFVVEDLLEPPHGDPQAPRGTFAHRSRYLPPYVRIKARRVAGARPQEEADRRLWTP